MRALITGIAGFAGSHLADLLLAKGYEIYGTVLKGESLRNIDIIKDRINLYNCDIVDEERVNQVVKEVNPERVCHLAAQSSAGKSFDNPKLTFEVNVLGTVNLLEALRKYCKKESLRILLVGSAEIYGVVAEKDLPISEEHPLRPISPYAASKAAVDLIGYQYYQSYKLNIIRTRAFNHTGPRQMETFVCASFAKQIAEIEKGLKEPVIHVGNLDAKRDFSDVRDIAKAYWLVTEYCDPGEVYNICSGKSYSIKEALDILLSYAKVKIAIKQDPARMRASDVPILVGDSTKFRKQTGWKPEIIFEKTLKDTLDYWRERV